MKKKQNHLWPTPLSDGEIRQILKAEKDARKKGIPARDEADSRRFFARRGSWALRSVPPCLRAEMESAARAHPMPQLKPIAWAMGAPWDYESEAAFQKRCERWLVRLGKKKPPRFTPPPPPKIKPLPHADNSARNGKWMNPGDIDPQDFPPSQE